MDPETILYIVLNLVGIIFGLLLFILQQIIKLNRKVSEMTIALRFIFSKLNMNSNIISNSENCICKKQDSEY